MYEGMEVKLHMFLNSALDGDKWSDLRVDRFTLGSHWIGGWVGPRAGLDAVANRKIPSPCQESNPDR
jgi:hypothetical protein